MTRTAHLLGVTMAGKVRLTKRLIDCLEPRGQDFTVWDDELVGLGLRVTKAGAKSFVLDYTTDAGRRRRQTIGRYGVFTVDQARAEAKRLSGLVIGGADPLTDKAAARAADTVSEFVAEYLAYMKAHKKPASLRADSYALNQMVAPKLGTRKLSAVTREDVAKLHRSFEASPYQANRMLATLRHLYTTAAAWGRVPQGLNPCQHVVKFKEAKRERYLSADELARLGKVLNELEPERLYSVRAVRLLLLTGCRLNEILSLAWADVDLDRAVLHLRDAKAGPRDVPLGKGAVALLASCDRDSEWVIPSQSKPGSHLVNLSKFWHKDVLPAAKFEGVRLHDLRHTVGSVGAGAGLSMLLIANVLGHKQVSTAERYSHVSRGPLHDAVDRISDEITGAMSGREPAEVVDMKAGRSR